jgi:U6 snRNA-associated Sm-like protein LSm1
MLLANLVLEDTVERIYQQDVFAESWRGLYLIRGENVVLLGEVVRIQHWYPCLLYEMSCQDLDREDDVPLRQVEWSALEPYHKAEAIKQKEQEEIKSHILYEQKGFCKEGGEGDAY